MSSSDSLEAYEAPFMTANHVIVTPSMTLSVGLFVYGLYVMIFCRCLEILLRRRKEDYGNSSFYLALTTSLFVIITVYVGLEVWRVIRQALIEFSAVKTGDLMPLYSYNREMSRNTHKMILISPSDYSGIAQIIVNVLAETMLIHRCHLIWGSRKIVTYPLIFIAFATATVGVASWIMSAIGDSNTGIPWKWDMFLKGSNLSSIYNITDTVFNGVLTILTALRIWSITREARAMLGRNVRQRYNGIMAIILESGSLYFAAQITSLVMYFAISSAKLGLIPLDMSLIVTEVAGIAPTLIIVRASLGKSVESVEHVVTTLRFADNLGPEDSQSRGDIPTLGLRVLGDDDGASESNTQITDPKTKNLKSEGAEAV